MFAVNALIFAGRRMGSFCPSCETWQESLYIVEASYTKVFIIGERKTKASLLCQISLNQNSDVFVYHNDVGKFKDILHNYLITLLKKYFTQLSSELHCNFLYFLLYSSKENTVFVKIYSSGVWCDYTFWNVRNIISQSSTIASI